MGNFVNKKPQNVGQTLEQTGARSGRQGEFNFSFQNQQLTREQKVGRKTYKSIAPKVLWLPINCQKSIINTIK
jgi:hypothetical protein